MAKGYAYIILLGLILLVECLGGGPKTEKLKISYDCIKCETRDTEIKFYIDFGKESEFNQLYIYQAYYKNPRIDVLKKPYFCYPSQTEMKEIWNKPKDVQKEIWKSLTKRVKTFECIYKSKDLKKRGIYTFVFVAKKVVWKNNRFKDEIVYQGSIDVEITKESNLPPEFLENKKIYKIGDVIKMKPLENQFIYKIEYKDSLKVLKCSKSVYELQSECNNECYEKLRKKGTPYKNLVGKCVEDCLLRKINDFCEVTEYKAKDGYKFVVIHYGLAIEEKKLKEKDLECPIKNPEKYGSFIVDLFKSGYCAIPITFETSKTIVETFINAYNQIYPMVEFLTGLTFGFIGGSKYEIVLIDSWDNGYKQYFPRTEKEGGRRIYYYVYSNSKFKPYVFMIPKYEEGKYLIGKYVTRGLFLLIIPVNKENVLFGVMLSTEH